MIGHWGLTLLILLCLFFVTGGTVLQKLGYGKNILLYLPMGVIVFACVNWFVAVVPVYLHLSWNTYFYVASVVFSLGIILSIWLFDYQMVKKACAKITPTRYLFVIGIILLAIGHATTQVGFWNVDNSMSDNSFYVSIATALYQSPHMALYNLADGMPQTIPIMDYYISTYEASCAYLAGVFQLHPAEFMRIIIPYLWSIASFLTIYAFFLKLLKKEARAFVSVLAFVFYVYFSTNYKGSLNDYSMEEWFVFYFYTGKAAVRYLVIPFLITILMDNFTRFQTTKTITAKQQFSMVVLLNIIVISGYSFSAAASIYLLGLLFIFNLLLLLLFTTHRRAIIVTGLGSAVFGIIGMMISFVTKISSNPIVSGAAEEAGMWRFLGINSEHFNLELFRNFVIHGQFDEYWYWHYAHIFTLLFALLIGIALLIYSVYKVYHEFRYDNPELAKPLRIGQFVQQYKSLLFFGVLFPFVYICFMFLPPIVELVSTIFYEFGYQRLIGSYPYELTVIALFVMLIDFIHTFIVMKIPMHKLKKWKKNMLTKGVTSIFVVLLMASYVMMPARAFIYQHSMDTERQTRLKFQDNYYNGTFNFARLLSNPTKLDYQAEQITQILSPLPGDKIVAGTINQFFGLSHVRNYDSHILVVRTRFSTYQTEELIRSANILKYYFSPWEKSFDDYQEDYSVDDVKAALASFNVTHLVVIKSYKTQKYFGATIAENFSDVITETYETEQFYIFELNGDMV